MNDAFNKKVPMIVRLKEKIVGYRLSDSLLLRRVTDPDGMNDRDFVHGSKIREQIAAHAFEVSKSLAAHNNTQAASRIFSPYTANVGGLIAVSVLAGDMPNEATLTLGLVSSMLFLAGLIASRIEHQKLMIVASKRQKILFEDAILDSITAMKLDNLETKKIVRLNDEFKSREKKGLEYINRQIIECFDMDFQRAIASRLAYFLFLFGVMNPILVIAFGPIIEINFPGLKQYIN
jgi:hypothetical protein